MSTCSRNGWTTSGPQNRPASWPPQHTATASPQTSGAAPAEKFTEDTEKGAGDVLRAWTTGTR
ncbi:hypothetical protein [Streptomyces sp. W4I9-2]|uniref:hypothetical protein n=1 Tax=Streptomyces sp. W4I9-2 TaxID=3042297 RepID=UPI00278AABB1|nr:hypothetical protein [Streptomyces sp. W4I9-2]MDQ0700272.1 hypothetical protein [Streptomyces sp. W4I9-2]